MLLLGREWGLHVYRFGSTCQWFSPQFADLPAAVPRGRAPLYDVGHAEPVAQRSSFLESLMDTDLYSMGAFFCDEHPELVDEVIERSAEIERRGSRPTRGPAATRSRRASGRC